MHSIKLVGLNYLRVSPDHGVAKNLIGQNKAKEIEKRFNSFNEDIKHWNDYDFVIINENLEICFNQIENIILNKKNFNFSSQITQ